MTIKNAIITAIFAFLLVSCAQPIRYGMTEDENTGIMIGSIIEKNIVIDSSQFENKAVKLSIRNVSGDADFDLHTLKQQFETALISKGYSIAKNDNFGIKFDINLMYSGQVRENMAADYSYLGGSIGAVAGAGGHNEARNMIGGAIAGATLGAIIGSHTKDDTYISVAEVTIAVSDPTRGVTKSTIQFSSSPPLQEEIKTGIKPFDTILRTRVAVYSGGRNIIKSSIVGKVRDRLVRIISDAI